MSVTPEMEATWLETALPTLLSKFALKDIYNADEFGLFYATLPSVTLHLSTEKCKGGKYSKNRLTGLLAASATGEKLPLLVVGKAKKPRCLCSFSPHRQLPRSPGYSKLESNYFAIFA